MKVWVEVSAFLSRLTMNALTFRPVMREMAAVALCLRPPGVSFLTSDGSLSSPDSDPGVPSSISHLTMSWLTSTLVDFGRCPEKRCHTAPSDLAISFEASPPVCTSSLACACGSRIGDALSLSSREAGSP